MPDSPPMAQSLRVARLRLHRNILYPSVALTALLGGVLTAAVWGAQDPNRLVAWAACLALVLALRLGVGWAHDRAKPAGDTASRTWLLRYRLCFGAHGMVWGAAGWWLQDASGVVPFSLLTISIVAIAAGSLNSTTFDVRAGLSFVACAMAPMLVAIYLWGDPAAGVRGLVMLMFLLATLIGARRAERIFEEAEGLRLAEAQRAEEARQHAQAAEAARNELAHKNYLLPLLLRTTRQGFWFMDNDGVTTDINPAMCELLGRQREDVLGHSVFDFFSDADLAAMRREIALCREGAGGNCEISIRRPDGTDRHCVNNATPMHDALGKQIGTVGIWTDITARRQNEGELHTYALVANSITDAVSAVGEDRRYRMVNDAWCRMTGRSRADVIGGTTSYVMAPFSDSVRREALRECIELQQVRVVRDHLQFPGSPSFLAETTYYPYAGAAAAAGENSRCVVMVTRDITAESNAVELIRRSEASQRELLDAFPGFITQIDQTLTYRYVNQRVAQRLNKTPDQMMGRTVRDVVGADNEAWLLPFVNQALNGEPVTYERRHDRGEDGVVFDQVTLVKGVDWRTGGWVIYAFGIDITERKMAEQRLLEASGQLARKSEELQLTLNSIDQGIVSFDIKGRVGIYNSRALTLMDLPPDLLDRLTSYDDIVRFQINQGDLAKDASFIDVYGQHQYFKGGRANSPDLYIRKNAMGAVIEVRTRHLDNGGLVRTFADVTGYFDAQQAVRENEAELHDLLRAFPGYIVAMDERFNYTYANERIAALLGKTPQEMIGHHVGEILGPTRMQAVALEVEAARSGDLSVGLSSYPATTERGRVDLEVTHVAGRIKANGRQEFYVFGIDVTARQQAQEALITARDAAESASRAKSEFLSRMSHELRTPMNAILGFGQLLELQGQSDQDRMDWGREVVKGGRHLLALINEVLDLARVESGKIAIASAPLALESMMYDCLMLVRPQADARHLEIALQITPANLSVMADPMRLKQVMLNLLGNAVKYNTEGGKVTVLCEVSPGPVAGIPDLPETVRISVSDTGRGLTAVQAEKLFQPFERLDANLDHIEGTGIGLALTKRLVELMQGSIGVQTAPGQGSTFWFTLPSVA